MDITTSLLILAITAIIIIPLMAFVRVEIAAKLKKKATENQDGENMPQEYDDENGKAFFIELHEIEDNSSEISEQLNAD